MTLEEAFPKVSPGVAPLGARVLVQLKTIRSTTKSGIVLVEETTETEKWNTQVAKVVAIGPLAFKNRETGNYWVEGSWVELGDYIRVPRWGGDRWSVDIPGDFKVDPQTGTPTKQFEQAYFVILNDHEVIGKIVGDPLTLQAFIL